MHILLYRHGIRHAENNRTGKVLWRWRWVDGLIGVVKRRGREVRESAGFDNDRPTSITTATSSEALLS